MTAVMLSSPPPALASSISLRGVVGIRHVAQGRCDVRAGHASREPVGAEQQAVAGDGDHAHRVDLDGVVDAERAGYHRPLRMHGGLLRRDPALAHPFRDEAVVVGELTQPAVVEHVSAAVTDMAEVDGVRSRVGDGERRSHAQRTAALGALREDGGVRGVDDVAHPVLRVGGIEIGRLDGRDRERGRDLAGLVSAHAIGDREHRRPCEQGVLVVVADPARVGVGPETDLHRATSMTVWPTCTLSPRRMRVASAMRRRFTYVPLVEPASSMKKSSPRAVTRA